MSADSLDLLGVAQTAGRAAAGLVRTAERVQVAATKSSPVDPVTQFDRDSEALIAEVIRRHRPTDTLVGEEGGRQQGTSSVRWIVDPIDGTVNFLYGLPEYAVSIAAEVDGEVVAGVVINVAQNVEYTAYRDAEGTVHSRRNGAPIRVRPEAELSQRLIATGFSYDPELRVRQAECLTRLIGRVRDIRRNGAAALELCHVAEGQLDGYFELALNEWDYAAGALIAVGAGAAFSVEPGLGAVPLVVCAPTAGFASLSEAVHRAGYGG